VVGIYEKIDIPIAWIKEVVKK